MRSSFVGIDDCPTIRDEVAVVIDVLRAFSFAAYALNAGVVRVILMDDVDETRPANFLSGTTSPARRSSIERRQAQWGRSLHVTFRTCSARASS